MTGHKFLFDRDAAKAKELFPKRRSVSMADVGLAENATDRDIVERACGGGFTIVTCNGDHFIKEFQRYLDQTERKNCHEMFGLVILPNGFEVQKRALKGIANKLRLNGRAIGWKDVSEQDCCVRVEKTGHVKASRFERCRYCKKRGAK